MRIFLQLPIQRLLSLNYKTASIKEQSLDTVASLGSNNLDGLRADCRGSDNLVASDKDDQVVASAR